MKVEAVSCCPLIICSKLEPDGLIFQRCLFRQYPRAAVPEGVLHLGFLSPPIFTDRNHEIFFCRGERLFVKKSRDDEKSGNGIKVIHWAILPDWLNFNACWTYEEPNKGPRPRVLVSASGSQVHQTSTTVWLGILWQPIFKYMKLNVIPHILGFHLA